MAVELASNSIELGIISVNADAMLKFYRDTLGFAHEGNWDMPSGDTMYRLRFGDTVVKIVAPKNPPPAQAPSGGIQGATGYRYWTIFVVDLEKSVEHVRSAGYAIPVPPVQVAPGVTIAMVEDPDGNWLEFVKRQA